MAFVNEFIPKEDFEKFGLKKIDNSLPPPGIPALSVSSEQWTVDRVRDMYLRQVTSGRFLEDSHLHGWTLYWRGHLLWFLREGIASKGVPQGPRWEHSRISKLKLPEPLVAMREDILADLREAFLVRAGGGVFSTATEFSQQIDFELE